MMQEVFGAALAVVSSQRPGYRDALRAAPANVIVAGYAGHPGDAEVLKAWGSPAMPDAAER